MKCEYCSEKMSGGVFGIGAKCTNPNCVKSYDENAKMCKKHSIKRPPKCKPPRPKIQSEFGGDSTWTVNNKTLSKHDDKLVYYHGQVDEVGIWNEKLNDLPNHLHKSSEGEFVLSGNIDHFTSPPLSAAVCDFYSQELQEDLNQMHGIDSSRYAQGEIMQLLKLTRKIIRQNEPNIKSYKVTKWELVPSVDSFEPRLRVCYECTYWNGYENCDVMHYSGNVSINIFQEEFEDEQELNGLAEHLAYKIIDHIKMQNTGGRIFTY